MKSPCRTPFAAFFFFALAATCTRAQTPLSGALANVHDPSTIFQENGRYYIFATGTGIVSRRSDDMFSWSNGPPVFSSTPAWATAAVPGVGHLWAPEVAYFNNKYHLYYSVSTFGSQVSAIGLVTNTTLDPLNPAYQWVDQGSVIQSNTNSSYNTIDPAIFRESNGTTWMIFGSYWQGIYATQLDPLTGKRISTNSPTFRLADREPGIEAAQMVERDGMFYLFVNWGQCCDGVNSTYNMRVGRSSSPIGPFVDKNGMAMINGAGSLVLGSQGRYIGPGHAGIYVEDGQEWMGIHFYDGINNGARTFDIRPLAWDANGWPVVGSFPAGDYDGDLDTDGADVLRWQRFLGTKNGGPDGNDDGTVNAADLAVWRQGFAAGQNAGAVPEPASATLAAIAVAVGLRRSVGPRRFYGRRAGTL